VNVELEIQRLKDVEAVKQLIARYAQAADAYAPPEMTGPLFTRDAVWNCEGLGHFETRAAIADGLAAVRKADVRWTIHFSVSPIIELGDSGEDGTAFWYLWELANARFAGNAACENAWVAGWYHARVRREDGQWRFAHMDLTLKLFVPAGGPKWPVD
jgi:hypothetical protein